MESQKLISIWNRWNPKYWTNLTICYAFGFLITLNLMTPNNGYIPYLFHIIPIFGISSIPNTDQYLESMESQILTYFGDVLCVVFPYTLNPMTTITAFIRRYASKISIWDWRNPKYWPNLSICFMLFHTAFYVVHVQVQYWTKFGIHLQFAESTYICGFRLHFAESTYSCGIQNN